MILAALLAMGMQAPTAGPGGDAAASGTLATFEKLCGAGVGDFPKAIARAEAMNWAQPNAQVMAGLPSNLVSMKDGQVRFTRTADGPVFVLFTGKNMAEENGAPGNNQVCGVAGLRVGLADGDFIAAVTRWAGGPPAITNTRQSDQQLVFAISEASGRRVAFSDNEKSAAQKALEGGKLNLVVALSVGSTKIITYIVPTQAN